MATLLETLNTTREETISLHYGAAAAELKDMVKKEPLRKLFYIKAGCVSEEITNEISHRFNAGGVNSTPSKGGIVSTQYYLTVDVTLPDNLIHPEDKKEEPQPELPEELKSEIISDDKQSEEAKPAVETKSA
jgi:hypothetical protein